MNTLFRLYAICMRFPKQILPLSTILFLLFLSFSELAAQSGQTDIRIAIQSLDCDSSKLFVDIEVRAESPSTTFNIADQNYRISFNRDALTNPTIDQELVLSGFVPTTNPTTNSFYSQHTLVGSLDTLVSYNVELSGGNGYPINDTTYVKVGRLAFDIVDLQACINFKIHTKDFTDFPPTVITEKFNNGALYVAAEGSYGDYSNCGGNACVNAPPVTNFDGATVELDTPISIDLADNDSDPEGLLDLTSIKLLSFPPPSQGVAVIDSLTGLLTFTPTTGFLGTVTTFQYEICDLGKQLPMAQGNQNPIPISSPDPMDVPVMIGNPECSTNSIFLNVQTNSRPSFVLRVLLEGSYDTNEVMRTTLNDAGGVPTVQPYNAAPWNYNGAEAVSSIPSNIVDWVLVTIRAEEGNATVIDTAAALLRNDGMITSIIGNGIQFDEDFAPLDSVFVAVYHRNHIGVMTAQKIGRDASNYYNYDFTTSASQNFGGNSGVNQIEPGIFGMVAGDFDANSQVQNSDFNELFPSLGLPGYRAGDLNLNGQVQNSDIQELLIPNLGRGASFEY